MGGGPGFTVHRMGGQTPRRRPQNSGQPEAPPSGIAALTQLLPLLLLFILPLLSSLFTGTTSSGPSVRYDGPVPPQTSHRVTPTYKIDYFVNPADLVGWKARQIHQLDKRAEVDYVSQLRYQCADEDQRKNRAINDATGFFFTDEDMLRRARDMPMPGCQRLTELRLMQQH